MRKSKSTSSSKNQISKVSKLDNKELQKDAGVLSSDWALVDPSRIRFQHSRIRPK